MKTERNGVKVWRIGVTAGMLALFAAMPSCSGRGDLENWEQQAEVGVLSLPLEAKSSAGTSYKLVGEFRVSGDTPLTLSAGRHAGSELRRSFAVGSYTIALAGGWSLLKRTDSGLVAATDVVLLSPPTQSFQIVDGEVTRVVFSFRVDGQVVFGPAVVPEGGSGGANGQDSESGVGGQHGLGGGGSADTDGQVGDVGNDGQVGDVGNDGQVGDVGNDGHGGNMIDDSGQGGAAGSAGPCGGVDDGGFEGGVGNDGQAGDTGNDGQAGYTGTDGQAGSVMDGQAGAGGNVDGGAGGAMGGAGVEDSGVPIADASSDDGASGGSLRAMAISTSEEEWGSMLLCLHAGSHSCAVQLDGSVVCWGANAGGELGNGTRSSSAKPVRVLGIDRAIQVTTGGAHSCARLEDGTVWCWGSHTFGQPGTPPGTSAENLVPFQVTGISRAVSISSANLQVCALLEDRTIVCWGNSPAPQVVMTDATKLSSGFAGSGLPFGHFVCAIRTDGSVGCWGEESSAPPLSLLPPGTPRVAAGVSDAVAIASGGNHACAVQRDGLALCWGRNNEGQLGDGTTSGHPPAYVQGLSGAIGIAAGRNHTCALLSQGSVMCWGSNSDGQVGDGTRDNRLTPVAVSGISRAIAISAAGQYTCALIDDHSIRCWGYNGDGALGNGADVSSAVPVTVADVVEPAKQEDAGDASQCARAQVVAAGTDHTCAVFDDGSVRCWGSNARGQLGNAIPGDSAAPIRVRGISPAISVSAGHGFSCALLADRTVQCWGDNAKSQLGMQCLAQADIRVSRAAAITSGFEHSCAIIEGGSVQCWGNRALPWLTKCSECGEPTTMNIQGAVVVSVKVNRSCVGRADGWVQCWGHDESPPPSIALFLGVTDLDVPSIMGFSRPATTIQSIANLGYSVCAAGDNRVSCLGELQYFGGIEMPRQECYAGFSSQWTTISSGIAVTAGSSHLCALRDDGAVVCWGGSDETLGCHPIPLPPVPIADEPLYQRCRAGSPPCVVPLPAKAVQVSAGASHTCAVLEDHSIACWGNNAHGQLGGGVADGGVGGTLDGGATPVVTGCQP